VPYHALSGPERETFNARQALLEHLGHLLRCAAVARERHRTLADAQAGRISEQSICYCAGFIQFISLLLDNVLFNFVLFQFCENHGSRSVLTDASFLCQ